MLLSITTTLRPATDLGYLLHKNPVVDLGCGGGKLLKRLVAEALGAPSQMAIFARGGP